MPNNLVLIKIFFFNLEIKFLKYIFVSNKKKYFLEKNITDKIQKLELSTFEELFKSQFKPLCAFAFKYLKDIDIAKEIVHDAFVNLWQKRDNIDLQKSIKSYLFTTVNNRSLNYIRDNKKFVKNEYLEQNYSGSEKFVDNDLLIEQELKLKITETLEKLPEKCRRVFEMSRYEGKKYREIAEELKISEKTVEAHISKALRSLKENLSEYLTVLIFFILNN